MIQVFHVSNDGNKLLTTGYSLVVTDKKIMIAYHPAPQESGTRKLLVLA
jgi:hypothetical protein